MLDLVETALRSHKEAFVARALNQVGDPPAPLELSSPPPNLSHGARVDPGGGGAREGPRRRGEHEPGGRPVSNWR